MQQAARSQDRRRPGGECLAQGYMYWMCEDGMHMGHVALPQSSPHCRTKGRRIGDAIRPKNRMLFKLNIVSKFGGVFAVARSLIRRQNDHLMSGRGLMARQCLHYRRGTAALASQARNDMQDSHEDFVSARDERRA
jgi:hypothetical protein